MVVEHVAPERGGVTRQVSVTRPRCSDLAVAVDEAHAGESVSAERCGVDAEQRQLAERTRGERIAARLVTGDGSLLDDRDVMTGARQPCGDRCSGRTTADDEDVGVQGVSGQPAAPGGEPGMASGPIGVISTSPIVGASGEV